MTGTLDTWDQRATVYLPLMWLSASLSIVGELSLISYYAFVPSDRSFFLKLVMYMSLFMVGGSCTWFTNVPNPSVPVCVSGAVLSTFFYVSTFLWSCCIGFAMLQETRRSEARGRMFEYLYLSVCTIIPAVCTAIPLALGMYSESVIEHEVGCWFTVSWARIIFFDGWIFFSWIINVMVLVLLRNEFKKQSLFSKLTPNFTELSEDRRRIFMSIVVSFILCWFWSLVLAVLALVRDFSDVNMGTDTTFPLAIIFAIFAPLQGFLNFLAFVVLSRTFRHNYFDMWRRLFCMQPRHQASFPHASASEPFLAPYTPFVGDDPDDDLLPTPTSVYQSPPRLLSASAKPVPTLDKYENAALAAQTSVLSASFEASVNGDGGIVPSAVLARVARSVSVASSTQAPVSSNLSRK